MTRSETGVLSNSGVELAAVTCVGQSDPFAGAATRTELSSGCFAPRQWGHALCPQLTGCGGRTTPSTGLAQASKLRAAAQLAALLVG